MVKRLSYALTLVALLVAALDAQLPRNATASEVHQDDEVLKELRTIRQLLERLVNMQQPEGRAGERAVTISALKGRELGGADAPLTIVEFTDLQCPFCRQFATLTFDQIKERWIDTGRLRYVSRDFPLDFHAQAMNGARAARCAGDQNRFWEMRLALVRSAHLLSPAFMTERASDLNLDIEAFRKCMESVERDSEIQADIAEAQRINVTGTPTFVIGRTLPMGGVDGVVVVGAISYAALDSKLTALLKGAPRSRPH